MQESNQDLVTREPVVAGQFYPGKPDELRAELARLFAAAETRRTDKNVRAIIAPHAGYVFSGTMAASSFKQLDNNKIYNTIFIIGSSHRIGFDGGSIYTLGHYKTPLGIVPVDLALAKKIVDEHKCFNTRTEAHLYEHSLEVQIPFLQYWLKNEFRIVPIVIGTQNEQTCRQIAEALEPYFTDENLFVISTDFSHYPSYEDACKVDKYTADAIISNRPQMLIRTLDANQSKGINNLATSLCGWTSVLTLMFMTEKTKGIQYIPVAYKNSGDALDYGDKSRVVGYHSIVVVDEGPDGITGDISETSNLSARDKRELLSIARKTIIAFLDGRETKEPRTDVLSKVLLTPAGAFVTLHEDGKLRGCIGQFEPSLPLYKVVQEMAVASATRDSRFMPVTSEEMDRIQIEISVLTPMKKIKSIDEIELGKHGIYIKKGYRSGTFLPQVASDTKWSLEEFLGHCARDKAGIGWDGWKDADIFVYEAIAFSE